MLFLKCFIYKVDPDLTSLLLSWHEDMRHKVFLSVMKKKAIINKQSHLEDFEGEPHKDTSVHVNTVTETYTILIIYTQGPIQKPKTVKALFTYSWCNTTVFYYLMTP